MPEIVYTDENGTEYTAVQLGAATDAEAIYNVIACIDAYEENVNIIDSVERATNVARKLLIDAGLDPDNTPSGVGT